MFSGVGKAGGGPGLLASFQGLEAHLASRLSLLLLLGHQGQEDFQGGSGCGGKALLKILLAAFLPWPSSLLFFWREYMLANGFSS